MSARPATLPRRWKAPQQTGYKGELQRLVNTLTLNRLLTLAANDQAAQSVRGITLMEIDSLQKWMQLAVKTASGNQKANLMFGLSEINSFNKNPEKFKPAPAVGMPDGSPIGMD